MKKIVIDLMQADLKVINKKEDFILYVNLLKELIDLKSNNDCELYFANKNEPALGDDIITHSDIFLYQDKEKRILKSEILRIEDTSEATYVYIVNDQFVLNDTPRSGFKGLFALDKKTNLIYSLDIHSLEIVLECDLNNEKAIIAHYPSAHSSRIQTTYKNIFNKDINLDHYSVDEEFINLVHVDNQQITATLKNTTLEYIDFDLNGIIKEFTINKNLKQKITKSIDLETAKNIFKKLEGEKSIEKIDSIFTELKELEDLSKLLNDSFEIKSLTTKEIMQKIKDSLNFAITITDPTKYKKISLSFLNNFYKMTEIKEKKIINKGKNKLLYHVVVDNNFDESLDSANFNIEDIIEMRNLVVKKSVFNIKNKEDNKVKNAIK